MRYPSRALLLVLATLFVGCGVVTGITLTHEQTSVAIAFRELFEEPDKEATTAETEDGLVIPEIPPLPADARKSGGSRGTGFNPRDAAPGTFGRFVRYVPRAPGNPVEPHGVGAGVQDIYSCAGLKPDERLDRSNPRHLECLEAWLPDDLNSLECGEERRGSAINAIEWLCRYDRSAITTKTGPLDCRATEEEKLYAIFQCGRSKPRGPSADLFCRASALVPGFIGDPVCREPTACASAGCLLDRRRPLGDPPYLTRIPGWGCDWWTCPAGSAAPPPPKPRLRITGPDEIRLGERAEFTATATGCSPREWRWTVTGAVSWEMTGQRIALIPEREGIAILRLTAAGCAGAHDTHTATIGPAAPSPPREEPAELSVTVYPELMQAPEETPEGILLRRASRVRPPTQNSGLRSVPSAPFRPGVTSTGRLVNGAYVCFPVEEGGAP